MNACNKDMNTPLLVACAEGHVEVVKLLLASGANVQVWQERGRNGNRNQRRGGGGEMSSEKEAEEEEGSRNGGGGGERSLFLAARARGVDVECGCREG